MRLAIGCFAVVCVLLLFLFPLTHGSFQETHGPTTAFRARKAFVILVISIVQGARDLLSRIELSSGAAWAIAPGSDRLFRSFSVNEPAILRC